jgi:hypothetical protein
MRVYYVFQLLYEAKQSLLILVRGYMRIFIALHQSMYLHFRGVESMDVPPHFIERPRIPIALSYGVLCYTGAS